MGKSRYQYGTFDYSYRFFMNEYKVGTVGSTTLIILLLILRLHRRPAPLLALRY